MHVFISFRTATDLYQASDLASCLASNGISHTFLGNGATIPSHMPPSEREEVICRLLSDELQKTQVLVVIASKETYLSGWVLWELLNWYSQKSNSRRVAFLCYSDNQSSISRDSVAAGVAGTTLECRVGVAGVDQREPPARAQSSGANCHAGRIGLAPRWGLRFAQTPATRRPSKGRAWPGEAT